jgi:hypothetical protein
MTTTTWLPPVVMAVLYALARIARIVATTWSILRLLRARPDATLQDAGEALAAGVAAAPWARSLGQPGHAAKPADLITDRDGTSRRA